jgi:membrane protein YdbS with pleckstrin-like domain
MSEPASNERPINAPPPAPAEDHHRPPDDTEVVYFEGRPQLRADQAKLGLWILFAIVLIALPICAWLFNWKWWPWPLTIVAILLAILIVAVPWLKLRATRYRISNYRIDFERGILKKQIDTLELWHVEDIHFEQGLLDRMFNVGSITVMSNDKTTPKLELHGVPHPREIFDSLKQRIIAVKRQRGVLKMDMG